jgi:hypothetical protein
VRHAKVLGDSFGAGAGVGVPLALVGYLWASTSGFRVDVDMCLFGSLLYVVNVQRIS